MFWTMHLNLCMLGSFISLLKARKQRLVKVANFLQATKETSTFINDAISDHSLYTGTSLVAQSLEASACNAGDLSSIPVLGRSPGEGNGNPLQYSCLENPMDGGAWCAIVLGVAKSRTQLSDFTSASQILGWQVGLVCHPGLSTQNLICQSKAKCYVSGCMLKSQQRIFLKKKMQIPGSHLSKNLI